MARERGGFSLARLPHELRSALQPLADTLSRISGRGDLKPIKALTGQVQKDVDPATVTLAELAAARNADAEALRAARVTLNEVIKRLQED